MHHLDLIFAMTASLSAAIVAGYVAFRLKLSPIVGYLLAGFALGTAPPGVVDDSEIAEQFAEIAVILLMFGVGLQFRLAGLLRVRKIAVRHKSGNNS